MTQRVKIRYGEGGGNVPSVNVLSQSATKLRLHVRRSVSVKAGKSSQKILVNSAWKYKVASNK